MINIFFFKIIILNLNNLNVFCIFVKIFKNKIMQKKIIISLDSELLNYTAEHFGYKNNNPNYSELVEKALLYFMKPQLYSSLNISTSRTKRAYFKIQKI